MNLRSVTDTAKIFRKAAERSFTDGTGLSVVMCTPGLMRNWWFFRDPVLYVSWTRDDYVMALCMLAAIAETGDLPKPLA